MLTAVLIGIVTLLSDFLLRSFLWGRRDSREGGNAGVMGIGLYVGITAGVNRQR